MNLFSWLILGHFIADWLLQSDWMALGKRRRFFSKPGLIHYGLYTGVITLIVQVFQARTNLVTFISQVGTLVFFSHWLIDGTNLILTWMRFFRQREQGVVYLAIDQTLHLLVLGLLAAWLDKQRVSTTQHQDAE
jgi:hypothetical protein